MRDILQGQAGLFQNLVTMQIGDPDFGCRYQILLFISQRKNRILEFGELRRAVKHLAVNDVGHIDFGVAIRSRAVSRKKLISARCKRAPQPLSV